MLPLDFVSKNKIILRKTDTFAEKYGITWEEIEREKNRLREEKEKTQEAEIRMRRENERKR